MPQPKNPSYRELKRAVEEHPAPWRIRIRPKDNVHELAWHEILDACGEYVATFMDKKLARRIVAAINAKEGK